MAEQSSKYKNFSDLEGRQFEIYLGTITYQVSLGNYMQFILNADDSNELQMFLGGVSSLQERLNMLKNDYENQLFLVNFSDAAYNLFPEELRSIARESLSRLAVEVNDLQVTGLEFIEGSVNGKIRVVWKGTYRFAPIGAAIVTMAGFDLSDFASREKSRVYEQSCISFGDLENNGHGDIVININPAPEKPADMQSYFSEPDRIEEELAKSTMKELDIPRPRPRPGPVRPQPRPDNE